MLVDQPLSSKEATAAMTQRVVAVAVVTMVVAVAVSLEAVVEAALILRISPTQETLDLQLVKLPEILQILYEALLELVELTDLEVMLFLSW